MGLDCSLSLHLAGTVLPCLPASSALRRERANSPTPGDYLHNMYVLQIAGPATLGEGLSRGAQKAVAWWLGGCAAWVFSMVVLGGLTRLTRSGLSMTDWKFTGERPPSSQVGASDHVGLCRDTDVPGGLLTAYDDAG